MTRPLTILLALLAGLALLAPVAVTASSGDAEAVISKKRKKCGKGKVRKKVRGQKKARCVRKKGRGTGTPASPPAATGPTIRDGSYTCFDAAGTLNIHGGTYDVNGGPSYPYTFDPATNIVNFPSGDYSDFYGVWEDPDGKDIQIRANYADEYTKPGDYLWTCSD